MLSLRWQDIDLDAGTFAIRQQLQRIRGSLRTGPVKPGPGTANCRSPAWPGTPSSCVSNCSASRCELSAARSFAVAGAGQRLVAVGRSRSQPMTLLYSCAVLQLGLGRHGSGRETVDEELDPACRCQRAATTGRTREAPALHGRTGRNQASPTGPLKIPGYPSRASPLLGVGELAAFTHADHDASGHRRRSIRRNDLRLCSLLRTARP
jgi:hypothetical protein